MSSFRRADEMNSFDAIEPFNDKLDARAKRIGVSGSGYEISVYDFRVRTPNAQLLTPKVIHSIEHLFAVALRAEFEEHQRDLSIINVSPMGCRTGFYVTVLNPRARCVLSGTREFRSRLRQLTSPSSLVLCTDFN